MSLTYVVERDPAGLGQWREVAAASDEAYGRHMLSLFAASNLQAGIVPNLRLRDVEQDEVLATVGRAG